MQNQMHIQSSYEGHSDTFKLQTQKDSYVETVETIGTAEDNQSEFTNSLQHIPANRF